MASERDISQLLHYMREECKHLMEMGLPTIRLTCENFMLILDKAEEKNTYDERPVSGGVEEKVDSTI